MKYRMCKLLRICKLSKGSDMLRMIGLKNTEVLSSYLDDRCQRFS